VENADVNILSGLSTERLTNSLETIRHLAELISMRHPHLKVRWKSLKEFTVTSLDTSHVGLAVFMLEARSDLTSKYMSQLLHTVAYSQDGNVALLDELPDTLGNMRCALFVDAGGATGHNNSRNGVLLQECNVYQTRVELTVNVHLTDATSDEMGVLRPEIKDGNLGAVGERDIGGEQSQNWGSKQPNKQPIRTTFFTHRATLPKWADCFKYSPLMMEFYVSNLSR
jgi:hypothetical protein